MPILANCTAPPGQPLACWSNYTLQTATAHGCGANITSLGNVFATNASGVAMPSGILCTITANIPEFWSIILLFFYVSLFFIYAVYPKKRTLLTIGGMGLIISTIMVSDSLIGGNIYVISWVIMVLSVVAYRFLPTNS